MKRLLLILALFPCFLTAQVVGPGFVDYVTSAPSGTCSQGQHQQNVLSTGLIYTCQSGTWATVGGGASGITGTLTAGKIPVATAAHTLGDGTFFDNGAGNVTIGTLVSLSAFAQSTLPAYEGAVPLKIYTPSSVDGIGFVSWNESTPTTSNANGIYGASYGGGAFIRVGVEGNGYTTADGGQPYGIYGYAQVNSGKATFATGVYGIATSIGGSVDGASGIAASFYADTVSASLTAGARAAGVWVADQGSNFAIKTGTGAVSLGGPVTTPLYNSTTNCSAAGTGANPSVVSCSAAPAGAFSCATNASTGTCQVNTTAVNTSSRIFVQPVAASNGLTCNAVSDTGLTAPRLASQSNGASFTITLGTFATTAECFNYWVVN